MLAHGLSAWRAAAAGAALGAVVALVVPLSRTAEPAPNARRGAPAPPRSTAERAAALPAVGDERPAPGAAAASASGAPPAAVAPAAAGRPGRSALAEWELPAPPPQPVEPRLACARGAADACARVAFELASRPDRKADELLAYRSRAVVAYAERCRGRQPVACVALARIHELGLGVAPDLVQAEALRARAQELCSGPGAGRAGCDDGG